VSYLNFYRFQDEIQRLRKENKEHEDTLRQLKYDLRYFESQNGGM